MAFILSSVFGNREEIRPFFRDTVRMLVCKLNSGKNTLTNFRSSVAILLTRLEVNGKQRVKFLSGCSCFSLFQSVGLFQRLLLSRSTPTMFDDCGNLLWLFVFWWRRCISRPCYLGLGVLDHPFFSFGGHFLAGS